MSNPATHRSTPAPSTSTGARSAGVWVTISPRMAIQAATGASINDAPSQKCDSTVNRFVKL